MAHSNTEAYILTKYLEDSVRPKWTIKRSDLGGRGLFACEPIPKGTRIFSNMPLAKGPRADRAGEIYCCNCYQIRATCFTCAKCTLIFCSDECSSSQDHLMACNFIINNWKLKLNSVKNSEIFPKILIYLHLLLLKDEQNALTSALQKNKVVSVEEIDLLCSVYEIPAEHKQFMEAIDTIIKTNSFRIPNNPQEKRIPLRGLYPLSAFLNHSCVPNTRNIFKKDYSMSVYASKDIEIGEEILTCYTGLLWSTPARRCQLYITKNFWCKCVRCEDSTEMGTNLSALKCLNKECVGVLLPISPLNPASKWHCDNCDSEVSSSRISAVQSVLGSLVGTLDLDDQFKLETLVLERLANFIPYMSHIFVELRLRLAIKLGNAEGLKLNELSESRLALKESLCRGTLRTAAALAVGDAHLRGLLLYHLHAALAERARRSPDLYEELKSEIESTIEQAYNILQGDISAPPDIELRRRYLGPGCDKPQEERFFILDA